MYNLTILCVPAHSSHMSTCLDISSSSVISNTLGYKLDITVSGNSSNRHSSKWGSSTYGHLHKTLFFSTPTQTLYFYIPVRQASSSYGHLFRALMVTAYESFHCNLICWRVNLIQCYYSSSLNGLWVNSASPWGRTLAEWAIDSEAMSARGITIIKF